MLKDVCLQVVSKLGSGSARGFALARDQVFYFSNSSINLPGLRAAIGVTHSYSSRLFLCALAGNNNVDDPVFTFKFNIHFSTNFAMMGITLLLLEIIGMVLLSDTPSFVMDFLMQAVMMGMTLL